MSLLSIEFLLLILFLLVIFIVNISQIFYLILSKSNTSIRGILINFSLSSLIISIYLIPSFYFRIECPSDSFLWRLWSFFFHLIDAVQIYSLFLLLTTRSFQKCFILLTWFIPIVAYSPILWLPSSDNQLDYLPYRRLKSDVPWWILPILYFSMYFIPLIISLIISMIYLICPWMDEYSSRKDQEKNNKCDKSDEHRKDMTELADLITTVMNFQLKETTNQSNGLKKWLSPSSSYLVYQHESLFLCDDFSLSPSSSIRTKNYTEQSLNSSLLLIISCLNLLAHLPYIILSLFDLPTLQLSTFIYFHWFGSLFLPMIHIRDKI